MYVVLGRVTLQVMHAWCGGAAAAEVNRQGLQYCVITSCAAQVHASGCDRPSYVFASCYVVALCLRLDCQVGPAR
jgi:hypothetical protein